LQVPPLVLLEDAVKDIVKNLQGAEKTQLSTKVVSDNDCSASSAVSISFAYLRLAPGLGLVETELEKAAALSGGKLPLSCSIVPGPRALKSQSRMKVNLTGEAVLPRIDNFASNSEAESGSQTIKRTQLQSCLKAALKREIGCIQF